MEPDSDRLDREAMLAEHAAAAEMVGVEIDASVAAAAEKRREYVDQVLDRMRVEEHQAVLRAAPEQEAARVLLVAARAAEDVRVASRARALRTLTNARDRARQLDLETEREAARLAELQERRGQLEREADRILAQPRAEAERLMVAAAAAEAHAAEIELEANEILGKAKAEADRLMAITDAGRREQVEREAKEMLANANAEADRLLLAASVAEDRSAKIEREANQILDQARTDAAIFEQERREQVERDVAEILAGARAEADRVRVSTDEERHKVRNLLAGALASLETAGPAPAPTPAAPSPETNLADDLSSRL